MMGNFDAYLGGLSTLEAEELLFSDSIFVAEEFLLADSTLVAEELLLADSSAWASWRKRSCRARTLSSVLRSFLHLYANQSPNPPYTTAYDAHT